MGGWLISWMDCIGCYIKGEGGWIWNDYKYKQTEKRWFFLFTTIFTQQKLTTTHKVLPRSFCHYRLQLPPITFFRDFSFPLSCFCQPCELWFLATTVWRTLLLYWLTLALNFHHIPILLLTFEIFSIFSLVNLFLQNNFSTLLPLHNPLLLIIILSHPTPILYQLLLIRWWWYLIYLFLTLITPLLFLILPFSFLTLFLLITRGKAQTDGGWFWRFAVGLALGD